MNKTNISNLRESVRTQNEASTPVSDQASLDTFSLTRHTPLNTAFKGQSKSLGKRARSKWYTRKITGTLLFQDSPIHKYYQRAFYCNHTLTQKAGKITSKYCNTRICNVCNRIRTAKLIDGYRSQLTGRGMQFVTLTAPNVSDVDLKNEVDRMQRIASNILKVFRVRRKDPLNGVRKLEITYNAVDNTYNPHFHMIVDAGEDVICEWLARNPDAKRVAQDCRPVDDAVLKELFKYTTKIVSHSKKKFIVYVKALDVIMRALKGRRCFQPFGDVRRVSEDVDDELEAVIEAEDYEIIEWEWHDAGDWVDTDTGELLTGHEPPEYDFEFRKR